ncbi:MAG: hypothetical protein PHS62_01465 [Patescibacteria group bacterium]|nr:hypothetical protein [Patescibacteria group bacterium]
MQINTQLLLLMISVPLLILGVWIFVIVTIVKYIKRGKKFSSSLSRLQVPANIRKRAEDTLKNYVPYHVTIDDILKNVGLNRVTKSYSKTTSGNKSIIQMYPLSSWKENYNYKDSFLKCYSLALFKSFNLFNYKFVSQYAIIKINQGAIESLFAEGIMHILFNNLVFGRFDFNNNKIYNAANQEIGTFTVPSTTKITKINSASDPASHAIPVAGTTFEIKSEIYINQQRKATILLQSSTESEIEKSRRNDKELDFNMFQNLNIQFEHEAVLILGFGVSFYALLSNMSSFEIQHQI